MDLREESRGILSCLLYLYWEAWAKHLSPTLSDQPSCSGHLAQGVSSGQSHNTPWQGRSFYSHFTGEELAATRAETMVARPWAKD